MQKLQQHPLFQIGSATISEASPCGENARYDSDFEQLEAELAKQESLAAETVDWDLVIDLASKILRQQSSDILVAAYLCYGLLLKEGYTGLAVGLKILFDMVDGRWDCLFPPAKRLRARQTAFAWIAEKSGQIIANTPPAADETAAVAAAADTLKQLDQTLVEKMGDQAPLFTDLSRPLKHFLQSARAEQEKARQPAAEAPVIAQTEAAPAASAESAAIRTKSAASAKRVETGHLASEADSKKALRQLQQGGREIAAFWLAQKLSDPRPYRLARQAVWLSVDKMPPDNDGITQIAPLPGERLKFFQTRLDKKDYAEVIPELEKTLARSPFWLDGHFMVVKALRALGPQYEKAVAAVIAELDCFLQRLPDAVDLAFSDQSPFASDQTKLWLQSEVTSSQASADSKQTATTTTSSSAAWDSALTEAIAKAASGDNAQAINILQQGLAQAGTMRAQMYWRCALAQLLLHCGNAVAASCLLEQVRKQVDETFMAGWEPELLSKIYHLLYQAWQKQLGKNKEDETLNKKLAKAYNKLCRFDPVTALSEKGG